MTPGAPVGSAPPQASPVGEGRAPKQNWALLGRRRWEMGFLWSQSLSPTCWISLFCVCEKSLEVEFWESARSRVFPQNCVCRITRLELDFMIILAPSKDSRVLFLLSLFAPTSRSLKATLKTFNPNRIVFTPAPRIKLQNTFQSALRTEAMLALSSSVPYV